MAATVVQHRASGGNMGVQSWGEEQNERAEEARQIRRLQMMISMVMSVIGQDQDLTRRRSFRNGGQLPAVLLWRCFLGKILLSTFFTGRVCSG